ncbi:MAG: hypothetical protein R6V56_03265 [Lentisphaeria bacterium]
MQKPKLKLTKYLRQNAVTRPLENFRRASEPRRAVIIPAMAESSFLPATLESLAANPAAVQRSTLVLVVVNQPEEPPANQESEPNAFLKITKDNQKTLTWLRQHYGDFLFQLMWIDAASPGLELPGAGGVGAARKIGCDSLINEFIAAQSMNVEAVKFVFLHLDADTLTANDYLQTAPAELLAARTDGAVIDFEHQRADDQIANRAIETFEQYLRYVVRGLRFAGSPYAFHTIGSAMACTAAGYIRAGGVSPKNQAGEDFYFLQQLAKNGGITEILETKVFPSARLSERNPYGTGHALRDIMREGEENYQVYAPESFAALKNWLDTVQEHPDLEAEKLLNLVAIPEVRKFVITKGFTKVWPRLQRQHEDRNRRLKAFHEWFDALATIRLIRHLTRTQYPPKRLSQAGTEREV